MSWSLTAVLHRMRWILIAGWAVFGAGQALAVEPNDLGNCPSGPRQLSRQLRFTNGIYICACKAVDINNPLPIYGSGIYTKSNSDICTAAVHAGVLRPNTDGSVKFEVINSPPMFESTTQNGVTSNLSPGKDLGAFQFAIGANPDLRIAPALGADDLGDCPIFADRTPLGVHICACKAVDVNNPLPIYGSGIYTKSNSDICTAAVHAGVLKPDSAGTIKFEVIDSPALFRGSTQNGIKSYVYTKKDGGAFQFTIGAALAQTGDPANLGECPNDRGTQIGLDKITYSCACPKTSAGLVIGSNVYDIAESEICAAAIHAGVLTRDMPGTVTFQVISAPLLFKGTDQNGITSESRDGTGSWGAFQFITTEK